MADKPELLDDQKKPNENVAPLEDQREAEKPGYHPEGDELKLFEQFKRRKAELLKSRSSVMGQNVDAQMRKWDKQYFDREADIPASELDPNQRPVAMANAFGKVQAALSILIDRNPEIMPGPARSPDCGASRLRPGRRRPGDRACPGRRAGIRSAAPRRYREGVRTGHRGNGCAAPRGQEVQGWLAKLGLQPRQEIEAGPVLLQRTDHPRLR